MKKCGEKYWIEDIVGFAAVGCSGHEYNYIFIIGFIEKTPRSD